MRFYQKIVLRLRWIFAARINFAYLCTFSKIEYQTVNLITLKPDDSRTLTHSVPVPTITDFTQPQTPLAGSENSVDGVLAGPPSADWYTSRRQLTKFYDDLSSHRLVHWPGQSRYFWRPWRQNGPKEPFWPTDVLVELTKTAILSCDFD